MGTSRESLKHATKEALLESLREQRELIRSLVVEALEDVALIEAMEEGRQPGTADRTRVLEILEEPS